MENKSGFTSVPDRAIFPSYELTIEVIRVAWSTSSSSSCSLNAQKRNISASLLTSHRRTVLYFVASSYSYEYEYGSAAAKVHSMFRTVPYQIVQMAVGGGAPPRSSVVPVRRNSGPSYCFVLVLVHHCTPNAITRHEWRERNDTNASQVSKHAQPRPSGHGAKEFFMTKLQSSAVAMEL